jgi:hypothetical protein
MEKQVHKPSLEDHVLDFLREYFPDSGISKLSQRIGFFTPLGWGASIVCVTVPYDLSKQMDEFKAALMYIGLGVSSDYCRGQYLVYITEAK